MKNRAYKQVDVFTATPYLGNPLGVVLDGSGLSTEQMQGFTDWTNLSECTFFLPPTTPEADYRIRIFCPGQELPFAGHPTLGSCHAWLEAGGKPKAEFVVQECGIGLVKLKRDGKKIAFAAPPLLNNAPFTNIEELASDLDIKTSDIQAHAWCDNGPKWQGLLLKSSEQVLGIKPSAALKGKFIGLVAPRPAGDECQFEVRAFFPGNNGVAEDPVTGSLNAAIAQWLIAKGIAPKRYVAAQGTALGRAGRVHIEKLDDTIWVGGESTTCITGTVRT